MNGIAVGAHDPRLLRRAFACFPTGVIALCCLDGDQPVGMAVSSFSSVSIDPPLVSVCIQSTSSTWPKVQRASRIGLSVLSEDQGDACRGLSVHSGDRFSGIDWAAEDGGAVFVEGAAAFLDCSIFEHFSAGDHKIILLRIHRLEIRPEVEPLVFHGSRFRRLLPIALHV